jgi:hypothetical protein
MDILRRAGVDENTALAWHINFETQSPEQHHSLLRALGFSREEMAQFKSVYEARGGESVPPDNGDNKSCFFLRQEKSNEIYISRADT